MQTLLQTLTQLVNNDLELANQLSDELEKKHPFILSTMLGFTLDYDSETSGHLMILYLLTWSHFREKPHNPKNQITQSVFEKAMSLNIARLNYLPYLKNDPKATLETVLTDLPKNIKSLNLIAIISQAFQQYPSLNQITPYEKALLLLGLKSIIQTLEKD